LKPWTAAEDRKLWNLVKQMQKKRAERYERGEPAERGYRFWGRIAKLLGRTTCAVQTRYQALLAGLRFERLRRKG
jgi:hypothetical protein